MYIRTNSWTYYVPSEESCTPHSPMLVGTNLLSTKFVPRQTKYGRSDGPLIMFDTFKCPRLKRLDFKAYSMFRTNERLS